MRPFVFACLPLLLAAALCASEPAAVAPAPPDSAAAVPDTPPAPPLPPLPDGFVYLRDVAPGVVQEIRYATAYNFVGERLDGYGAAECVLAEAAARALAAVHADLAREGLGLKVYDCYRPQRAVNHFVRWVRLVDNPNAVGDQRMKDAFYPTVDKRRLFREGYIARRSGHSRGATVDLTLVRMPHAPRTAFPDPDAGPLPRCDSPAAGGPGGRLDEGDLDMGTAYDCLSPLAATDSPDVTAAARANRARLREAMSRRGFRNYAQEWWHFTLRDEPFPGTHFDFPIGEDATADAG